MIVSCRNSKQSRYNKALLGSETVKYLLTPFAIPDEMRSLKNTGKGGQLRLKF